MSRDPPVENHWLGGHFYPKPLTVCIQIEVIEKKAGLLAQGIPTGRLRSASERVIGRWASSGGGWWLVQPLDAHTQRKGWKTDHYSVLPCGPGYCTSGVCAQGLNQPPPSSPRCSPTCNPLTDLADTNCYPVSNIYFRACVKYHCPHGLYSPHKGCFNLCVCMRILSRTLVHDYCRHIKENTEITPSYSVTHWRKYNSKEEVWKIISSNRRCGLARC